MNRFTVSNLSFIFKNLKPYRFLCPECILNTRRCTKKSVHIRCLWDEKSNKYKFYAHCNRCKYTTPAYETTKSVIEHVHDNFQQSKDSLKHRLEDLCQ